VIREDFQGGARIGLLFLDKNYIHSYNFYWSDFVNKFLRFCVLPLLALKMATKILVAIFFMSKLFPNFWSNDIWHIDFSWYKVVRANSTGTTNGTWSEKAWEPLTSCKQEATNRDEHGSGLDQDWSHFLPDQDWIGLRIFFFVLMWFFWKYQTFLLWSNFTGLLNGNVYFAIKCKNSAGTILHFELYPPLFTYKKVLGWLRHCYVLANNNVKNVSVTLWFCLQCSCKKCL